jgi:hypothetical protein
MNTTFEQAATAKAALKSKIGRPGWLRGIGIALDDEGHFVKVNVAEITTEVCEKVPRDVEGVRVELEAVGEILAHASSYDRR